MAPPSEPQGSGSNDENKKFWGWSITIDSIQQDGGQGAAEGPLELRVLAELRPEGGQGLLRVGSVGRVAEGASKPGTGASQFLRARGNDQGEVLAVKVRVTDRDLEPFGPGTGEAFPDDVASVSTVWQLAYGQDSSKPLAVLLREVGTGRGTAARVLVSLAAKWGFMKYEGLKDPSDWKPI